MVGVLHHCRGLVVIEVEELDSKSSTCLLIGTREYWLTKVYPNFWVWVFGCFNDHRSRIRKIPPYWKIAMPGNTCWNHGVGKKLFRDEHGQLGVCWSERVDFGHDGVIRVNLELRLEDVVPEKEIIQVQNRNFKCYWRPISATTDFEKLERRSLIVLSFGAHWVLSKVTPDIDFLLANGWMHNLF